jgi:LysM repeat protein
MLAKAQLGEITAGDNPQEVPGTLVDVQFNPTTLRVQISNRTAGGQQAGSQARQRPGTGEMQVSFDLAFDTADEGTTDQGVSVLTKTATVERFVRPKGPRAGQEAPPRVVFKWGGFVVQGTMENAGIDLDLFDAQGVPLRAKVSVTIKGQDPRWTYTPAPAAPPAGTGSSGAAASRPGAGTQLPAGSPGTQGNSQPTDRVVQAMPGESLAQLATRSGLDPSDWRALADGVDDPLQLPLGQEVALPAGAAAGAASGQTTLGNDPAGTSASLPLVAGAQAARDAAGSSDRSANPRDTATDPVVQGQAVAGLGGLARAITQTRANAHQEAATASRGAFGLGAGAAADATGRPWGAGVPLRPRFGGAAGDMKRDPTQAGWVARPAAPPAASVVAATVAVAKARTRATPTRAAGCGCRGRRRAR